MAKRRVLTCWIGHDDLRAMAGSLPDKKRDELLSKLRGRTPPEGEVGPIKTLLQKERFNQIFLFSNYSITWTNQYLKWLDAGAKAIRVALGDPTDYHRIFTLVDEELRQLKTAGALTDAELCFHLSPGTPAMTGIWLLLGKSRYPATLYQTFKGKSWVTKVPFDLVDDFAAEVFREADAFLQHLLAEAPSEIEGFDEIVGDSRSIRLAVGRAKRAALRHFSVLLLGESGTGKELFAEAIHHLSSRRNRPFVPINCAAISRELLESELFGHGKGAFTGAEKERDGAFAAADGGTLFLDEVGECDPAMQAKLLRVLQPPSDNEPCRRTYIRVGESKERSCDVRIIAATNRDLVDAVNKGNFREDLFYRLANITIKLPPLRERKSDIPKIAQHLLTRINDESSGQEPGFKHKKISESTMKFIKNYRWPGNVRQLYNALIQAAVMAEAEVLQRRDLEAALSDMPAIAGSKEDLLEHPLGDGFSLEDHLNQIKKHYLQRAMDEAAGTKRRAADLLGIANYQTLDIWLKKLNVGNWK